MKYHWPDGDTMTVICPRCGNSVETQISVVKEENLPVRPEECQFCYCDFEVHHDGKINLIHYIRVFPPSKPFPW